MPENADNPAPKKNKRGRKPVLTVEDVAHQLGAHRGNLTRVAKKLGVQRSSVQEFIGNHPKLQKILQDEREGMIDCAEDSIQDRIIQGEGWAVIWCLKTLGAKRGWVEPGIGTVKDQIEEIKKQLREVENNSVPPDTE